MGMNPKHDWKETEVQSGEILRVMPACLHSDDGGRSSALREELHMEGNFYSNSCLAIQGFILQSDHHRKGTVVTQGLHFILI